MRNIFIAIVASTFLFSGVACKQRRADSEMSEVSPGMIEGFKNSPFRKEGACAVNYIIMNGYTRAMYNQHYSEMLDKLLLGQAQYKAFYKYRQDNDIEHGKSLRTLLFAHMSVEQISANLANVGYFNPWYVTADMDVLRNQQGLPSVRMPRIEQSVLDKLGMMNDWFKGYGQGRKVDPRSALVLAHKQAGNNILLGTAMLASLTVADRLQAQAEDRLAREQKRPAGRGRFATLINQLEPPSPKEADHLGQIYHFYGYASMRVIDGVVGRLVGELVTYGYEIFLGGEKPDYVDYYADRAGIDFGEAVAATLYEFPTKAQAAKAYQDLKCEDGVLNQGVTTQAGAAVCEMAFRRAPSKEAAIAAIEKWKKPDDTEIDSTHTAINNLQRCQELAKADLNGWRLSAKNAPEAERPNFAAYWYGHGSTRSHKGLVFYDEATAKMAVEF